VQVADTFGHALTFTYYGAGVFWEGLLESLTDPAGNVYRYGYDGTKRLTRVSLPDETPGDATDNPTRSYLYEDTRLLYALTGIVDENDERYATYAYDEQGRAILSEHAGGAERTEFLYNPDGTTTVTDALGKTSTYSFQTVLGVRKATQVSEPCAGCGGPAAQDAAYDANGNVVSRTDYNGVVTTYAYDLTRNLETRRTEAVGTSVERTITTEWHAGFRLPVRITEPGKETTFGYDGAGRLLSRTETDTASGASRTRTYTYNPQGLLASVDGPRTDVADVTTYAYDAEGNLISTTDALGHVTQVMAHDAHGRPLTLVDANSLVTQLAYDARGRLLSRHVAGALTGLTYDAAGNLTRITLPDGRYLEYGYDAAHRLVGVADSLGNRIDYTLDALGNRVQEDVRDPAGVLTRTRTRVYDSLNRLIRDIGGAGQVMAYAYDAEGNRTAITDPNLRLTSQSYDALSRLLTRTDPLSGVTAYGYDGQDNLVRVTDARGNATTYLYDGLGNQRQLASPDTGTTTYQYDAAGNRIRQTDARGITVTYTYDALNRLTAIAYPDPAENVSFTYDAPYYGIGRLTRITDASGVTDYLYDARGRLLSETRTVDGVAYTTQYSYDAADNLTGITYPSGRHVAYRRDGAGRITEVSTFAGGQSRVLATDIQYLPFGPLHALTFGNGLTLTRSFDADYRLTAQRTGGVQDLSFALDAAGNVTAITDGIDLARSQSFGYDALDRVVAAGGLYGTRGYAYDAAGNRTRITRDTETDTYTIDPLSNRLDAIAGADPQGFAYDPAGNTLTAGALGFAYNQANRLAEVTAADGSVGRYTYNALGERVKKLTPTGTILYHYDQFGHLIAETDGAGNVLRQYLYLDDLPLAVVVTAAGDAPTVYDFVGSDGAGQPVTLSVDTATRQVTVQEPGLPDESAVVAESDWMEGTYADGTRHIDLSWWTGAGATGDYRSVAMTITAEAAYASLYAWDPPQRQAYYAIEGQDGAGNYSGTDSYGSGGSAVWRVEHSAHTVTIQENDAAAATYPIADGYWWDLAWGDTEGVYYYYPSAGGFSFDGAVDYDPSGDVSGYLYTQEGEERTAQYQLYGPGAQSSATRLHYLHTDHLGTPQLLTDASQQVVWQADYAPFGEATVTMAEVDNPLRFPGQYFDPETGLHYNYFRDYDPSTGRYVESDPIGLISGLNTYAYVNGNPVRFADPSGLFFGDPAQWAVAAEAVSVATGVAASTIVASVAGVAAAVYPQAAGEGSDQVPDNVVPIPGFSREESRKQCPVDQPDGDDPCQNLLETLRKWWQLLGQATPSPGLIAADAKAKRAFNDAVDAYNTECVPRGYPWWSKKFSDLPPLGPRR
jgi:RHS repeat-associated protein